MKYIDEFRDGEVANTLAGKIAALVEPGRRYSFMEFCGGQQIELPVSADAPALLDRPRPAVFFDMTACRLLNQDGGLGLVFHLRAQAQQAGSSIEEASHARGAGTIQLPLKHGRHRAGPGLLKTRFNFGITSLLMQNGRRHAPRLACRAVATGQWQRSEVPQALAIRALHSEQFTAPRFAIRAEPDAVQCQAQHRGRLTMLGADRSNVRVMMRHGEYRQVVADLSVMNA